MACLCIRAISISRLRHRLGTFRRPRRFLPVNSCKRLLLRLNKRALAPDWVKTNAMLGDIYAALGHQEEARTHYEKALVLAKTVEPEFQSGWVAGLEKKLSQSKQ